MRNLSDLILELHLISGEELQNSLLYSQTLRATTDQSYSSLSITYTLTIIFKNLFLNQQQSSVKFNIKKKIPTFAIQTQNLEETDASIFSFCNLIVLLLSRSVERTQVFYIAKFKKKFRVNHISKSFCSLESYIREEASFVY